MSDLQYLICTIDRNNKRLFKKGANMRKLISIDLDGVLNNYDGNYNETKLPEIKQGAKNFLQKLSENYRIEIFTTRNIKMTVLWLIENGLIQYVENVSNVKNQFSSVFVDDRAINFDGDLEEVYQKIIEFRPYWKK